MIKTTFEYSIKVKIIANYELKGYFLSALFNVEEISGEQMLMSAKLRVYYMNNIFFGSFLGTV